jgi:hypothetical protein
MLGHSRAIARCELIEARIAAQSVEHRIQAQQGRWEACGVALAGAQLQHDRNPATIASMITRNASGDTAKSGNACVAICTISQPPTA